MKRLFHLYGQLFCSHIRSVTLELRLDIDHDGSITPKDFEILADKLSSLVGQGDGDKREQYALARKGLCEEIMRADANQDGKVTLGQ